MGCPLLFLHLFVLRVLSAPLAVLLKRDLVLIKLLILTRPIVDLFAVSTLEFY